MTFCSTCAVGHDLATEWEEVRISDWRRNSPQASRSILCITAKQTQVTSPLSHTIIHLPLFSLHILKSGNEAEINIREVSIVSLASPEPCANELILHPYIYIKSAVIIDIGQNAFVCFKKKNHTCTPPKSSNSYFSLYVQTNKRDKKRNWRLFLKITGQNLTSEICMHAGLCTCQREALCHLKSNYFSNECHRDLSQDNPTSGLFYTMVK